MATGVIEPLLTEHELAQIVKMSVKTLRNNRVRGVGFPYYKMGVGRSASVRYALADVLEHLDRMKHEPSVVDHILQERANAQKAR